MKMSQQETPALLRMTDYRDPEGELHFDAQEHAGLDTPDQVQQLLRDIEQTGRGRSTEDVWSLPPSIYQKIRYFFLGAGLNYLSAREKQTCRRKILEAIGLCSQQFKRVQFFNDMYYYDDFWAILSSTEVEVLLQPFKSDSSASLTELGLTVGMLGDEGSGLVMADVLLSAKSLEALFLVEGRSRGYPWSSGFAHFAHALVDSNLSSISFQRLCFHGYPSDVSIEEAKYVVAALPSLTVLQLYAVKMEDGAAREIGRGVALHPSLQELLLFVEEVGQKEDIAGQGREVTRQPIDTFLSEAFGGRQKHGSSSAENVKCSAVQRLVLFTNIITHSAPSRILPPNSQISHLLISNKLPTMSISYSLSTRPPLPSEQVFEWGTFFRSLKDSKHLTKLTFPHEILAEMDASTGLAALLEGNRILQDLEITIWDNPLKNIKCHWSLPFRVLQDNTCLRNLKLPLQSLAEMEDFKVLMASLQVNSTLQTISFGDELGGPKERIATVQEALKAKARQLTYLDHMRLGMYPSEFKWTQPQCGRIFLCGNPMAGKTRLLLSMLNVRNNSLLKRAIDKCFPDSLQSTRTKGIEVHTLRSDDHQQLLVWDLAGQTMFRTLQQYLFPRFNRACIFLFVFSVYDRETNKPKNNMGSTFEKEFREWLKYLASNSKVTGLSLVQVTVILTHRDMLNEPYSYCQWAKQVLENLNQEYANVIEIHPDPFYIDGHRRKEVQPIVEHIYTTFDSLFQEKLPEVPEACFQMSKEVVKWAQDHPQEPVVDCEKFFKMCEDHVEAFQALRQILQPEVRVKVLRAVVSYLNDVGTIIEIPKSLVDQGQDSQLTSNSHLIVVNPNWLTHVFLGDLIGIGHEFPHPSSGRNKPIDFSYRSWDGFLEHTDLHNLLKNHFLIPLRKQNYIGLSQTVLRHLMEGLDICYEVRGGEVNSSPLARYFLPCIFKVANQADLKWPDLDLPQDSNATNSSYLGLRVRCKDQRRTYLSAAFYNRFQVTFWRKWSARNPSECPSMQCTYNLISMAFDGHSILVENDEDGNYIDVLVKSAKPRKAAWECVMKIIVDEMREFCASSKGSPGVELVVDILRTDCARELWPCAHRKLQAVSPEELKERWKGDHLYMHTWPQVSNKDRRIRPGGFENASDLLPPHDVEEVRQVLRVKEVHARKGEVLQLNDAVYEMHWPPEGDPQVELVFIHGIVEDESDKKAYLTTWSTRSNREECWLNTWLLSQIDLKSARILSVSYDSSVRKTECQGRMDIYLTGESLTSSLITFANVGQYNCPVVLVGHCLGGLLMKEVCLHASSRAQVQGPEKDPYEKFLENVKGFFFFSTPHLGFQLDSQLVDQEISLAVEKGELMQSLEVLNNWTSRLNYSFSQTVKKYRWKTGGVGASNKVKIPIFKDFAPAAMVEIVVKEASARAGSDAFCVVERTDHFTICKPETATSDNLLHLVIFINQLCRT